MLLCRHVLAVADLDTRKRNAVFAIRNATICGRVGHLKKMCRQREKSVNTSSSSNSCSKSSGKSNTSSGNRVKCYCCGQIGHRRSDCPHKNENCSRCGKRGHLSQACRSDSGGNSNARAVEVSDEPEDEECKEIQHAWTLSVCKADDVINSGNVLNMIVDSGAEEHVVSVDDWRRLGAPTLKPVQIRLRSATGDDMGVSGSFVLRGWCDDRVVEMTALVSTRATRSLCSATKLVNAGYSILMKLDQSVLRHSGGGSILLQMW